MNYEVGKYYKTRAGRKAMCVYNKTRTWFVIFPTHETGSLLLIDVWEGGKEYLHGESHDDIISPWIDKPDIPWHLLPKCARFCAADSDNTWFWYQENPCKRSDGWLASNIGRHGLLYPEHWPSWPGDWEDSLVERPKV